MILTVTLNPSIDHIVAVRRILRDDVNRPVFEIQRAGGKGVNVSRIVRLIGGKTRAYVVAAGKTGSEFTGRLRREGIPARVFTVPGETRTSLAITDLSNLGQIRLVPAGPRVSAGVIRRLSRSVMAGRRNAFACVLSGSLPPGLPAASYGSLIAMLQRAGLNCALDADGEALKLGMRARPYCIKPNRFEMERLAGSSLNEKKLIHTAKRFVQDGIRHVVVSLEAEGALFASDSAFFYARPPAVKVFSRVGAGDALLGGFLAGLEKGGSAEDAARLGTAAASAWVSGPESCPASRREIEGLIHKVRIEKIKGF